MITRKVKLNENEWAYIVQSKTHTAIIYSNGLMTITADTRTTSEIAEEVQRGRRLDEKLKAVSNRKDA